MVKQEGREFHTHTQKKDGQEGVIKDEFKRSGQWADHSADKSNNCSVSSGVTISRGNFQFARVDVGLTFGFDPEIISEDDAYDIATSVVDEILSREEGSIRQTMRAVVPMREFGASQGIAGRSIYIGYGLTMNGSQKFESHRIDVGRTLPIADDASIEVAFESLGEQLGSRISMERSRIENRSGDKGL